MEDRRQLLFDFAAERYGSKPEYLFQSAPDFAVLRHAGNRKWYAVFMYVTGEQLGRTGKEQISIVNLKCDPLMLGSMCLQKGFYPAYHMHKSSWITVSLAGEVPVEQLFGLLQTSYALVARGNRKLRTEPKAWLIPANPKYADLAEHFERDSVILWTQTRGAIVGDTVYLYECKPISAIRFACEVIAVHEHYEGDCGDLNMQDCMRLRLLHRYSEDALSAEVLADYGIRTVRGARGVPEDLLRILRIL